MCSLLAQFQLYNEESPEKKRKIKTVGLLASFLVLTGHLSFISSDGYTFGNIDGKNENYTNVHPSTILSMVI